MRVIDDPSGYNRGRYRRDPAERLKRINHTRRMRGAPPVSSLAEVRLRIPMEGQ